MTLDHAIERIQFCYPQVGVDAVRGTSVLEARRLHEVLARLSRSDLAAIIGGLETLARACRQAAESKCMG